MKSFKERSSDVMGALGNCIGLPAVTVPSGFSEDDPADLHPVHGQALR